MATTITTADLDWQCVDGIEIPVSKQFGDVYFSKDNGLLETRHVFLNGNDLATRLADLKDFQYFNVAETGFGTGLNILALWQLWQQVRPDNHSHLHAISVEKYPLHKTDLIRALNAWPELKPLADQLIEKYPILFAGCHRLTFPDERFSIDLWLGDAHDVFPMMVKTKAVDAWFLDGFAPSCNPDMWHEQVLEHIIRLSDVGTTFASFSVAAVIKNGLKNHGISISRPRGFGHKREMLKAIWNPVEASEIDENHTATQASPTIAPKPTFKQRKIAIIGAGIAGLSCAYMFAQRGHEVVIYDKSAPLAGGSGNPLALLNPKLSSIEQSAEHLMTLSWQFALDFYQKFRAFRPLSINQLIQSETDTSLELADQYPDQVLKVQSAEQSPIKTEYTSLQLTKTGAVYPHLLRDQILENELITFKRANVLSIEKLENDQLILNFDDHQTTVAFDHVIVCASCQSNQLFNNLPFLRPIRGQVSWLNNQECPLDQEHAYSFGGYAMQLDDAHLIMGASFYPNRDDQEVLDEDHVHNFELFHKAFPEYADHLENIDLWYGRASVRAQSPDYFPLLGKMDLDKEIYTYSGLGSKGFLFSPLCAEVLVAHVLGEACPVSTKVMKMVNPRRFIKKVKPRKPYYQKPEV